MDGAGLRVGQFTGFHGDRADGMAELLASGVDVLTGDYLAELTMLVLAKNRQRGGAGYVDAFVRLLTEHITAIAADGVRVITNAGGLDPLGCADAVRNVIAAAGVELRVAAITGDDVRAAVAAADRKFPNLDTGAPLDIDPSAILTANAYLGAWPIAAALHSGADIVICPRVTDASLIVGAAAWHYNWSTDDYDRLAGAVVAGHIIECGAQATGGNFSFFRDITDRRLPGMPIATVAEDGGAVITKSTVSGGLVSIDTVKAQLFYEIGGAAYQNPDVVVDLSSVQLAQAGEDQVRISGIQGFAPTDTLKVSLTYEGGYRNSMTVGLTGAAIADKAARLDQQLADTIGPPESFDGYRRSLIGPASQQGTFVESTAWYIVNVRDQDRDKVDRHHFADRFVQLAIASVPGFYLTTPPQQARLYGVQWPTLIPKTSVTPAVHVAGEPPLTVAWPPAWPHPDSYPVRELARLTAPAPIFSGEVVNTELGALFGFRSGDKAGTANLGVWARSEMAYLWLAEFLTPQRFVELVPEAAGHRVERHLLSNLCGMNFLIIEYLEAGVSSSTRIDPQAKALGEYLGGRIVAVPAELLKRSAP